MFPRPLVLATAAVALSAALTACGGSDSSGDSSGDSGSSGSSDFVSGTAEEWLKAACGDEIKVNPYSSDDSLLARYGEDATEGFSCASQYDQGTDDYSYVEAALFDADPSDTWNAPAEAGKFQTYAIGQVSEDEWAVVYEDSSLAEVTDPHLEPLTDFGFEVFINNEPVS